MIDGRFLWGLLLSVLFHVLIFAFVVWVKPGRTISLPLGAVYNVKIYQYVPPKPVRRAPAVKTTKVKKRPPPQVKPSKREIVKPKEVLYNKKRVVKGKPVNKSKPKRKRLAKKREHKEKKLLAEKLKEMELERRLERRIEELRREVIKGRTAEGIVATKGGSQVGVSHSSAEIDPLLRLYLSRLVAKIQSNWSLPSGISGREAVVDVKIDRKGRLVFMELEKPSGDPLFDGSCMRAVRRSFPFDPLPEVYEQSYLEIGVRFRR